MDSFDGLRGPLSIEELEERVAPAVFTVAPGEFVVYDLGPGQLGALQNTGAVDLSVTVSDLGFGNLADDVTVVSLTGHGGAFTVSSAVVDVTDGGGGYHLSDVLTGQVVHVTPASVVGETVEGLTLLQIQALAPFDAATTAGGIGSVTIGGDLIGNLNAGAGAMGQVTIGGSILGPVEIAAGTTLDGVTAVGPIDATGGLVNIHAGTSIGNSSFGGVAGGQVQFAAPIIGDLTFTGAVTPTGAGLSIQASGGLPGTANNIGNLTFLSDVTGRLAVSASNNIGDVSVAGNLDAAGTAGISINAGRDLSSFAVTGNVLDLLTLTVGHDLGTFSIGGDRDGRGVVTVGSDISSFSIGGTTIARNGGLFFTADDVSNVTFGAIAPDLGQQVVVTFQDVGPFTTGALDTSLGGSRIILTANTASSISLGPISGPGFTNNLPNPATFGVIDLNAGEWFFYDLGGGATGAVHNTGTSIVEVLYTNRGGGLADIIQRIAVKGDGGGVELSGAVGRVTDLGDSYNIQTINTGQALTAAAGSTIAGSIRDAGVPALPVTTGSTAGGIGDTDIGGGMAGGLRANTGILGPVLVEGGVLGASTVNGTTLAGINLGSVLAPLTVTGTTVTGLTVNGDVLGALTVTGNAAVGNILVTGDVILASGAVTVTSTTTSVANVTIGGALQAPVTITANTSVRDFHVVGPAALGAGAVTITSTTATVGAVTFNDDFQGALVVSAVGNIGRASIGGDFDTRQAVSSITTTTGRFGGLDVAGDLLGSLTVSAFSNIDHFAVGGNIDASVAGAAGITLVATDAANGTIGDVTVAGNWTGGLAITGPNGLGNIFIGGDYEAQRLDGTLANRTIQTTAAGADLASLEIDGSVLHGLNVVIRGDVLGGIWIGGDYTARGINDITVGGTFAASPMAANYEIVAGVITAGSATVVNTDTLNLSLATISTDVNFVDTIFGQVNITIGDPGGNVNGLPLGNNIHFYGAIGLGAGDRVTYSLGSANDRAAGTVTFDQNLSTGLGTRFDITVYAYEVFVNGTLNVTSFTPIASTVSIGGGGSPFNPVRIGTDLQPAFVSSALRFTQTTYIDYYGHDVVILVGYDTSFLSNQGAGADGVYGTLDDVFLLTPGQAPPALYGCIDTIPVRTDPNSPGNVVIHAAGDVMTGSQSLHEFWIWEPVFDATGTVIGYTPTGLRTNQGPDYIAASGNVFITSMFGNIGNPDRFYRIVPQFDAAGDPVLSSTNVPLTSNVLEPTMRAAGTVTFISWFGQVQFGLDADGFDRVERGYSPSNNPPRYQTTTYGAGDVRYVVAGTLPGEPVGPSALFPIFQNFDPPTDTPFRWTYFTISNAGDGFYGTPDDVSIARVLVGPDGVLGTPDDQWALLGIDPSSQAEVIALAGFDGVFGKVKTGLFTWSQDDQYGIIGVDSHDTRVGAVWRVGNVTAISASEEVRLNLTSGVLDPVTGLLPPGTGNIGALYDATDQVASSKFDVFQGVVSLHTVTGVYNALGDVYLVNAQRYVGMVNDYVSGAPGAPVYSQITAGGKIWEVSCNGVQNAIDPTVVDDGHIAARINAGGDLGLVIAGGSIYSADEGGIYGAEVADTEISAGGRIGFIIAGGDILGAIPHFIAAGQNWTYGGVTIAITKGTGTAFGAFGMITDVKLNGAGASVTSTGTLGDVTNLSSIGSVIVGADPGPDGILGTKDDILPFARNAAGKDGILGTPDDLVSISPGSGRRAGIFSVSSFNGNIGQVIATDRIVMVNAQGNIDEVTVVNGFIGMSAGVGLVGVGGVGGNPAGLLQRPGNSGFAAPIQAEGTIKLVQAVTTGVSAAVRNVFTGSTEGWTVSGDGSLVRVTSGGNPGGFIRVTDAAGGATTSAQAPGIFLGDWTGRDNFSVLSFDARDISNAGTVTVTLTGPGGVATYTATLSGTTWQSVSIPINQATWTVSSGTWAGLMASVTQLSISADAGATAEVVGLDNIQLTAGAAVGNPAGRSGAILGDVLALKDVGLVRCNWFGNEVYILAGNNIGQVAQYNDNAATASIFPTYVFAGMDFLNSGRVTGNIGQVLIGLTQDRVRSPGEANVMLKVDGFINVSALNDVSVVRGTGYLHGYVEAGRDVKLVEAINGDGGILVPYIFAGRDIGIVRSENMIGSALVPNLTETYIWAGRNINSIFSRTNTFADVQAFGGKINAVATDAGWFDGAAMAWNGNIGSVVIGGHIITAGDKLLADLYASKNIGKVESFVIEGNVTADGNLGPVIARGASGLGIGISGDVTAGGNIASVTSAGSIVSDITAGGRIGPVKVGVVAGGAITRRSDILGMITAGVNGPADVQSVWLTGTLAAGASISASRNLPSVQALTGIEGSLTAGANISKVLAGGMDGATVLAGNNIGTVTVNGAILDTFFSAGRNITNITAKGMDPGTGIGFSGSVQAGGNIGTLRSGGDLGTAGGGPHTPIDQIFAGGAITNILANGDIFAGIQAGTRLGLIQAHDPTRATDPTLMADVFAGASIQRIIVDATTFGAGVTVTPTPGRVTFDFDRDGI